jgi:hypothetical protein
MNKEASKRDFQIRKSNEVKRKAPLTSRNSIHLDKDVVKGLAQSYAEKEASVHPEERKISSVAPNVQARLPAPSNRLPPITTTNKSKAVVDYRSNRMNYGNFGDAIELHRPDKSDAGQLTPRSKITVGKPVRPLNSFTSQTNLIK